MYSIGVPFHCIANQHYFHDERWLLFFFPSLLKPSGNYLLNLKRFMAGSRVRSQLSISAFFFDFESKIDWLITPGRSRSRKLCIYILRNCIRSTSLRSVLKYERWGMRRRGKEIWTIVRDRKCAPSSENGAFERREHNERRKPPMYILISLCVRNNTLSMSLSSI